MMALRGEPGRFEHAPVLRIGLASNIEAPSLARAAIRGFFESEVEPGALATITLLVSELVSNAVIHSDAPSSSEILLQARLLNGGALRVEVTDQGNGSTPVARDPNEHGGGYGLYLVDSQATCWGVERRRGTCVWFEMPCRARDRRRMSSDRRRMSSERA